MFSTAPAKAMQLSPQVKPLDFGWRSCVNVLPVWRLGESSSLPFHNFFHCGCHLRGCGSLSCLDKKVTEGSERESSYCAGLPAPSPSLCCQSVCCSASYCFSPCTETVSTVWRVTAFGQSFTISLDFLKQKLA